MDLIYKVIEWLYAALPTLIVIYAILPIFFFLLMLLLAVAFAESLTNAPNRNRPKGFDKRNLDKEGNSLADLSYETDSFGIFTSLIPGRAKVIETSGGGFVDVIMNHPGNTFFGYTKAGKGLSMDDQHFWEIVNIRDHPGAKSLHPTGHWSFWSRYTFIFLTYRLAWWGWQRILCNWKGWVFVGPNGYRQILTTRLEYFISDKDGKGNFYLERRVSSTDHYRVQRFQTFVGIGSAETRSLISTKQVVSQLMWVKNPYQVAYETDGNWGSFIYTRISSVVNSVVNKLSVENVVALDDASTLFVNMKLALGELVRKGGAFEEIGFMYKPDGLTLPDRSIVDPENEKKLGDRAIAYVDAEAEVIRAGGDARARIVRAEADSEAITLNATAINEAGPGGIQVADIEGRVRQVGAAPEGAVVIVGGSGNDQSAALLALLTEINGGKNK